MDTVGELRDMLSDFDDDTPLRAAVQPSYPLGAYVAAVTDRDGMVWIAVSDGDDYDATRDMWN
jgi:hypothetical protein